MSQCTHSLSKRITLDIFTAYLGVTIGALILYVSYILALEQYPLGITIIFACLTYIVFKKKIVHVTFPTISTANTELLKKAVDTAPDVPHFNYHLGMAYSALQNPLARKHLTVALETDLKFPGREEAEHVLKELP